MNEFTFMSSLLTFYLKGKVKIEQNRVNFKVPNTILKFIPLGSQNSTVSIEQISSVNTSFSLDFKAFVISLIVMFVGISSFSDSVFGGLILSLIGIGMLISSFSTIMQIEKTSSQATTISFLIFEKKKAYEIASLLNEMINNRVNDTNIRIHTTDNTNRIIDAIKSK